MRTALRTLKIFLLVFAILWAVSGLAFPFTGQTGFRGYLVVLLASCAAWTCLGAIWVWSAGKNRSTTDELERHGFSPDVIREMRQGENTGGTLGLEVFYSGLAAVGIVYSIYRQLEPH
jgi:hypothetical protein